MTENQESTYIHILKIRINVCLTSHRFVQLNFLFFFPVPVVTIEGSPDIHAQAGSSVTLKCSISEALQRPKSVKWQVPILSFMRVFLDLPERHTFEKF